MSTVLLNTGDEAKANSTDTKTNKKEVDKPVETVQSYFSDSENTNINLSLAFNGLLQLGPNNKDIILFAYYLYKRNLIDAKTKEDYIIYSEDMYFCNAAKRKLYSFGKNSMLEKLYGRSLFPNDSFHNFGRIPKEYCENPLKYSNENNKICERCIGKDKKHSFSHCPYEIAAIIISYAKANKQNPDKLFKMLLGNILIPFDNEKQDLICEINSADIKDIDSKSAYCAYILIRDGFIRSSTIDDEINYSAIRLCDCGDNSPKLKKVLDFWKSKSSHDRVLKKDEYNKKIDEATCKICRFNQCPERLAAYFDYLSIEYNCNPIDLAYYVASHSTYCNLDFKDDFQYNKYSAEIQKSALTQEDKEDCFRRLNYITSKGAAIKKKATSRPVLPINIAIKCKDLEAVKDFIDKVFFQSIWFNDYFDCGMDNYHIVEFDVAEKITDDIIDFYKNLKAGSLIILTNLSDAKITNCQSLIKALSEKEKAVATFIVDEDQVVSEFFSKYPKLKTKVFSNIYTFNDLSDRTVFEEILLKIQETLDVSDDMQIRLARYISATYNKSGKESSTYIKDTYENLIFRHFSNSIEASDDLELSDIPSLEPKRTKEEIFKDLDALIGLENVKQQLREIASLVEFDMKLNKNAKGHQSMHMIFNGNPGTGKTTVARLTAEILYSIGFIQENKLVQCSAKDLIGEYLGQTGPKTAQKCEEAYNGILFIDEAYQLNPYNGNNADQYKEECVAELIQQMENNRDRLVVIFAGYTDEMNEFLEKANTGLKSRLQQVIEFNDYSVDELMEIFRNTCKKEGMKLTDTAAEKARLIFQNASLNNGSKFGNARYVRNVFDKSYRVHAVNCSNIENNEENAEKLMTFTPDEITPA